MRECFSRAEFSAAGALYDSAIDDDAKPSYDDVLLRARIFLKHDESRAVAFLIGHPPKRNSPIDRGLWAQLLGVGYARMRDFERADHHLALAKHLLTAPAARAHVAYDLARRFMLEGRLDEAWRSAEDMLDDRSVATKIAYEMLRSFILCQEEHYRASAESLIKAVGLIGKHREKHLEEWFHAVQNLALFARELAFDDAAAVARVEIDQPIEWPEDFRTQRFQALKAVGWTCALRGDMLGCFRYLRTAEQAVPNKAFEAILRLDRSYFARIVGEQNWALDEIAKAEAIAADVDWNALSGDERVGLLLLAKATSFVDPEKARYYLARYKGLDKIRSPLHLFAFDHRIEAIASDAEGMVRVATSEAGAEDAFRKAWVIFDRIGYDWRAAHTALRLFDATGKNRWLHLAEDKLEAFPQSWLVQEARKRKAPPSLPTVKLPPMQRKVFGMLCQKMTTAEIAAELGLSQHTVRNHLKAVFRTYGVNNRAALIAEAASRGDLPA